MQITKQQILDLDPCYSEEEIDKLAAGRTHVTPQEIADLDIPKLDILWVLTRLMTREQLDRYEWRIAVWAMNAAWEMPKVEKQDIEWAVEELERDEI